MRLPVSSSLHVTVGLNLLLFREQPRPYIVQDPFVPFLRVWCQSLPWASVSAFCRDGSWCRNQLCLGCSQQEWDNVRRAQVSTILRLPRGSEHVVMKGGVEFNPSLAKPTPQEHGYLFFPLNCSDHVARAVWGKDTTMCGLGAESRRPPLQWNTPHWHHGELHPLPDPALGSHKHPLSYSCFSPAQSTLLPLRGCEMWDRMEQEGVQGNEMTPGLAVPRSILRLGGAVVAFQIKGPDSRISQGLSKQYLAGCHWSGNSSITERAGKSVTAAAERQAWPESLTWSLLGFAKCSEAFLFGQLYYVHSSESPEKQTISTLCLGNWTTI